nr:hypothetical protein [Acinetobacter oleivorans]
MTVKTTGFTLRDALEAKTKRLRNKFIGLVTPSTDVVEALENVNNSDKLVKALVECAAKSPSPIEDLLRLQQSHASAQQAASLYTEMFKNLNVVDSQITKQQTDSFISAANLYAEILKEIHGEGQVTTPRTRLGAEALRDTDIDLDTVNYAFDRAMKQSHG